MYERLSVKVVKLSINHNIVGLVHKHAQRACLMYHAACKVEFQPFNLSYSQQTLFFIFYKIIRYNIAASTCFILYIVE